MSGHAFVMCERCVDFSMEVTTDWSERDHHCGGCQELSSCDTILKQLNVQDYNKSSVSWRRWSLKSIVDQVQIVFERRSDKCHWNWISKYNDGIMIWEYYHVLLAFCEGNPRCDHRWEVFTCHDVIMGAGHWIYRAISRIWCLPKCLPIIWCEGNSPATLDSNQRSE